MTYLQGIIHVHSQFSYDGQHTLQELVQYGRQRGYSFIGMSEHSDTFSAETMSAYVDACHQASVPDCLLIPGIEFTCENNLHLIGLGVRHYTSSIEPLAVSEFIQQNGGVAIVAHPERYRHRIPIDLARAIDGIEVWNAGYDGRFVPNARSLQLLQAFQRRNKAIYGFGGQDLHQITDQSHVQTVVLCDALSESRILTALKQGRFAIANAYFTLDAQRSPGYVRRAQISLARKTYRLAKTVRDAWIGT